MAEKPTSSTKRWVVAYWVLLVLCIFVAGGLNMARIRAGFLTNYLADLTGPAFLYIVFRGLTTNREQNRLPIFIWLGATAERSAIFLFLASTMSELSSYFWPRGPLPGTFDPLDIVAYGVGLLICYIADRRGQSGSDSPV